MRMRWKPSMEIKLNAREEQIAGSILREIKKQVAVPATGRTGLSNTRSSSQRCQEARVNVYAWQLRLARSFRGVLYVLDEPSIGLHPKTSEAFGNARSIARSGQSVLVVEHDEETIRRADYVCRTWPPAPARTAERWLPLEQPRRSRVIPTRLPDFTSRLKKIEVPERAPVAQRQVPDHHGARANNLKEIDVSFPLGC